VSKNVERRGLVQGRRKSNITGRDAWCRQIVKDQTGGLGGSGFEKKDESLWILVRGEGRDEAGIDSRTPGTSQSRNSNISPRQLCTLLMMWSSMSLSRRYLFFFAWHL